MSSSPVEDEPITRTWHRVAIRDTLPRRLLNLKWILSERRIQLEKADEDVIRADRLLDRVWETRRMMHAQALFNQAKDKLIRAWRRYRAAAELWDMEMASLEEERRAMWASGCREA